MLDDIGFVWNPHIHVKKQNQDGKKERQGMEKGNKERRRSSSDGSKVNQKEETTMQKHLRGVVSIKGEEENICISSSSDSDQNGDGITVKAEC